MDGRRFDGLTRSLASGVSRRSLIKGLFAGGVVLPSQSRGYAAQYCLRLQQQATYAAMAACILEGETCCGGGLLALHTDVCCGEHQLLSIHERTTRAMEPNAAKHATAFPGQCGNVTAYCGNDPNDN